MTLPSEDPHSGRLQAKQSLRHGSVIRDGYRLQKLRSASCRQTVVPLKTWLEPTFTDTDSPRVSPKRQGVVRHPTARSAKQSRLYADRCTALGQSLQSVSWLDIANPVISSSALHWQSGPTLVQTPSWPRSHCRELYIRLSLTRS